jgi:ariadne-1
LFGASVGWTEHFITSIDNGHARRIRCMAIQCSYLCDYQTVFFLLSARDPLVAARFECVLMESYIDDNDRARWCPSNPPCGYAILIQLHSDRFCEVECVCGTKFCFNCLSEAHSPCTCQIWGMWSNRFVVEKQNIDWIEANIKLCPGCGNGVEKAGGCNHMSCRCGQTFW